MKVTRTITVNVPENFPDVDSDRAQRMAEIALGNRVTLLPDAIGSGTKVLRLTVTEDVAESLRVISGNGSMALAWRRLFSTVAGVRPAPRLSRSAPARVVEGEIIRPRPRALPSAGDALPIPVWFDAENPNRVSYWRSLGTDSQRNIIESYDKIKSRSVAQSNLSLTPENRSAVRDWLLDKFLELLPVLLFAGLVWLLSHLRSQSSSGGGSAPSGPRYRTWRPS